MPEMPMTTPTPSAPGPRPLAGTALIVDASFLATQIFHAVRRGQPEDDLRVARSQVARHLAKLRQQTGASQTLMAVDLGRTWRHQAYAPYKQGRSAKPPELRQLRAEMREIGRQEGFRAYRAEGFEADDVIAALATRAAAKDWRVVIYSNDLDLMSLCSEQICVQTPTKTVTGASFERDRGFLPARLATFKAIAGDSSDNIPGVHQLGERSAAALVAEHSSIQGIWDRMLEHPKRVQSRLLAAQLEDVLLYERLATLTPPDPSAVVPVQAGELEAQFAQWQAAQAAQEEAAAD